MKSIRKNGQGANPVPEIEAHMHKGRSGTGAHIAIFCLFAKRLI
jgi:hypothetical protein